MRRCGILLKLIRNLSSGEIQNKRKDGTEYWQEVRMSPILDEQKNVKFFIGVEPNVTDTRNRLELTLDSMIEGFQIISPDWRYVYLNKTAASQGKRTRDELAGRTMMEMYPGIEKTEFFINLKNCMDNKIRHTMENEFQFPDGSKGWFELRIEPIPEGALILSLDITGRKKADDELKKLNIELEDRVKLRTAELQQEKDKASILLESVGDGVVAIDTNWNIIVWNKAAEEITGWKRDEVFGKPLRDYLHFIRERDRAENTVFIGEAMLYGKTRFMENHTILIKQNKEEIYVGDSSAPIMDINGKVSGVIIVFRDLTKDSNAQSLKTDFQYAAHQMRTPVTKILWDLESALDIESKEQRNAILMNAIDSAASISKLADQLLSMAEIDQDIVIARYETIDLFSAISGIFANLDKVAKRSNIKLACKSNEPVAIDADKKLLERILFEVIDNAIKYNKDSGGVEVTVQKSNGDVVIEIRDTGIGITDEHQPLIFNKFFRGSNYDTSKIPGAGLGLFISRAYIKLMKGKIWFKSEAGKGTSFSVLLPKVRR